jgi:DNA-binding MarR family transcriptional regulator
MRNQARKKGDGNDYLASLGPLALAARLKRLSDRMMHDGRLLYRDLRLNLEPNWYLVFLLLEREGKLSITEVASALGWTHPSLVSLKSAMLERGFLQAFGAPEDGRRKLLRLSKRGLAELERARPVWDGARRGVKQLLDETGVDVLQAVGALEAALARSGFRRRTLVALGER